MQDERWGPRQKTKDGWQARTKIAEKQDQRYQQDEWKHRTEKKKKEKMQPEASQETDAHETKEETR